MIAPAVDVRTLGVTVIGTLLPDTTVPLFGDIESKVVAFASPVIAQLSGALPELARVKVCGAEFFPWVALNVNACVVITMAGRDEGPTVRIGGGLTVTVAESVVTLIVTFSVKGLFVPCWKK